MRFHAAARRWYFVRAAAAIALSLRFSRFRGRSVRVPDLHPVLHVPMPRLASLALMRPSAGYAENNPQADSRDKSHFAFHPLMLSEMNRVQLR